MPPKNPLTKGIPRPRNKTSSSALQLYPNNEIDSNAADKTKRPGRLESTFEEPANKWNKPSTSKKSPLGAFPSKPNLRSNLKRSSPGSSNSPNESIRGRINPPAHHRREPAIGETIDKKARAIAQKSKHPDVENLNVESGNASLSKSSRQGKEHSNALAEESGPVISRLRKSSLIDRRKRESTKFGNASSAENSRRQSKRLSLDVGKPPREQNSGSLDASWESSTEVLVGQRWRMFRASPLYGFSGTPRALKRYGRELLTYLTDARAALPDAGDVRYATSFTMLPALRWGDDRPEALKVEVQSLIDGRKPIKLYNGILLSWGKEAPSLTEDKCSLPLLLCTGVIRTMQNVHLMLARLFDTVIQPMMLSESDFEWICAISMRPEMPPPAKSPLYMHYAKGKKRVLSVSVSALRVHQVWCRIRDQNSHMVTPGEVEQLRNELLLLGPATQCIELSKLVLSWIDFPNVRLFLDGHLTIKNKESVDFLLRYFCGEPTMLDDFREDYSSVTE